MARLDGRAGPFINKKKKKGAPTQSTGQQPTSRQQNPSTSTSKPTKGAGQRRTKRQRIPTSQRSTPIDTTPEDEEEAWARGEISNMDLGAIGDESGGEMELDELQFVGGEDLASPVAGPSRLPMTPVSAAPSSFTPLPRSILSGMARPRRSASRSPSPSGIDIIIDEQPDPSTSRPEAAPPPRSVGDHFEPPALFSTSLDTALQSSTVTKAAGTAAVAATAPTQEGSSTSHGLLLPDNITLDAPDAEPGDNQASSSSMEGVHFVDDNIAKGVQRYFVVEKTEEETFLANADQSKICQNCKLPGHRANNCTHIICTVCGVMDKHERKDCPHGLVCYGCGQRGHRQNDCPDPKSRNAKRRGCDRCGGWSHPEAQCPSLWRVYTYYSQADRLKLQRTKQAADGWAQEAIGGYAGEEWCYNCAKSGHLGDDCPTPRWSGAKLFNPTAFSQAMSSRGPFYAHKPHLPPKPSQSNATPTHARWEDNGDLPFVMPGFGGADAGRRTREKARQNMAAREQAVSDVDEDDWFNGRRTPMAQTGRGGLSIRGRGGRTTPNGRGWGSESRPTQGRDDPPRNMPFGHSHLMASAPHAIASQRFVALDRLDSPQSGMDSPTANRARPARQARSGPSGSNLLAQAMDGARRARSPPPPPPVPRTTVNSSRPLVTPLAGEHVNQFIPIPKAHTPVRAMRIKQRHPEPVVPRSDRTMRSSAVGPNSESPLHAKAPATLSKKARKQQRKAAEKQDEDDLEAKWWSSGKAGGNVADWGKDLPGQSRGDASGSGDSQKGNKGNKGNKGQQYTGGY